MNLPGWPAAGSRRDAAISLLALLGLLAWDASRWDLLLIHQYGGAGGFAWRDHWFSRDLAHTGGRWLAYALLGALLVNVWWPLCADLDRHERVWWLLLTLLSLLAVPALKRYSSTSCPWSLAEFGGTLPWVSHWQFGLADGGSGHCFPSGHAASAFAFFSGHFMLRERHPLAARRWLLGVLAIGALFAWAQMARGAHYLSHSLWSAWLCWVLAWLGSRRVWAPRRWSGSGSGGASQVADSAAPTTPLRA